MKSLHRFGVQNAKRVKYAEIEIAITKGRSTFLAPDSIQGLETGASTWKHGVFFAISLLESKVRPSDRLNGIELRITSFRYQPVDTSFMTVAFATYQALAKALAPELTDHFVFDEKNWQFNIR